MANTITITGPTFTNKVGVAMPAIPGLLSMAYFGTGYDNNNGNRVAGGPAFATLGGTPIYQSNCVTLGNISAVNTAIDTQNPRLAPLIASGWSWAAVARCTSTTGTGAAFLSDAAFTVALNPTSKVMTLYYGGAKATYTATSSAQSFRFIALTYSGTALGTILVYDFTDAITPVSYTAVSNVNPNSANSLHFGVTTEGFANGQTDIAFGMVASGVLTQTALGNIYASVKTSIARRGITI